MILELEVAFFIFSHIFCTPVVADPISNDAGKTPIAVDGENASSRIKNGERVSIKDYPYIVDIRSSSGSECTGSIIGKKHILSAAHCFDDAHEGSYRNEYYDRKEFYVGFEYIGILVQNSSKVERHFIEGIAVSGTNKEQKRIIQFPIWEYTIAANGLGRKPFRQKYTINIDLIDLALITVRQEMVFNPGWIEKAQLDPPSTNCQTCSGECSPYDKLEAVGLGEWRENTINYDIRKTAMKCKFLPRTDKWKHVFHAESDPDAGEYNLPIGDRLYGVCAGDSGGPLIKGQNRIVGVLAEVSGEGKTCKIGQTYAEYVNVLDEWIIENFIRKRVDDVHVRGLKCHHFNGTSLMPHDSVYIAYADFSVCCPKSCNTSCNDCLPNDPKKPNTCTMEKMCDQGNGGANNCCASNIPPSKYCEGSGNTPCRLEQCLDLNEVCNPSATGTSGDPRCCTPNHCNPVSNRCEEYDDCQSWGDDCDPTAQPGRASLVCCESKGQYCNPHSRRCENIQDQITSEKSIWLSKVPDDRKLSKLSIPGTHGSLTYNLLQGSPTCFVGFCIPQESTLEKQLEDGVRFINLELGQDLQSREKINCYYGETDLKIDLRQVLDILKNFLEGHPGEMVLLQYNLKGTISQTLNDIFNEYSGDPKRLIYSEPISDKRYETPKLGQVRGKVVLINSDKIPSKGSQAFNQEGFVTVVREDGFGGVAVENQNLDCQPDTLVMKLKDNMDKAGQVLVVDQYYISWVIYKLAKIFNSKLKLAKRISCQKTVNFAFQLVLHRSYEKNKLAQVGIVVMDYPLEEYINNIIRFNFQGSMKYVAMGCPRKHRDTQGRVFARPRNFKHGVRCCGEIIPCKTPECSIGKKTFDEALLICKNLNMELCDTDQLNSCCNYYSSDANCGYDSEWVWVKNHDKEITCNKHTASQNPLLATGCGITGKCSRFNRLELRSGDSMAPIKCCPESCGDFCGALNCHEADASGCCYSDIPDTNTCGVSSFTNAPCTLGVRCLRSKYAKECRKCNTDETCGGDCTNKGGRPPFDIVYCVKKESVDCEWSPWNPWTPCSKSCGSGTMERTRIKSQLPEYGGMECLGSERLVNDCKIRDCPYCQYTKLESVVRDTGNQLPNGEFDGLSVLECEKNCNDEESNGCQSLTYCPNQNDALNSNSVGRCRLFNKMLVGSESTQPQTNGCFSAYRTCETVCGTGYQYMTGNLINIRNSDPANTPQECLDRCNNDATCVVWDFGFNCGLFSNEGNGPTKNVAFSFGPKNCVFDVFTRKEGYQCRDGFPLDVQSLVEAKGKCSLAEECLAFYSECSNQETYKYCKAPLKIEKNSCHPVLYSKEVRYTSPRSPNKSGFCGKDSHTNLKLRLGSCRCFLRTDYQQYCKRKCNEDPDCIGYSWWKLKYMCDYYTTSEMCPSEAGKKCQYVNRGNFGGDLFTGQIITISSPAEAGCFIKETHTPVNGGWSSWTDDTPCSKTCHGGVRRQKRLCDNPKPRFGGRSCVGDRFKNGVPCNEDVLCACTDFSGRWYSTGSNEGLVLIHQNGERCVGWALMNGVDGIEEIWKCTMTHDKIFQNPGSKGDLKDYGRKIEWDNSDIFYKLDANFSLVDMIGTWQVQLYESPNNYRDDDMKECKIVSLIEVAIESIECTNIDWSLRTNREVKSTMILKDGKLNGSLIPSITYDSQNQKRLIWGADNGVVGVIWTKTIYRLLQKGKECNSGEKYLGQFETVENCAYACFAEQNCKYFIYGYGTVSNKWCYHEYHQVDATTICPDGFQSDSYNFYELIDEQPPQYD